MAVRELSPVEAREFVQPRRIPQSLTFERCQRGYLLRGTSLMDGLSSAWAFDSIDDVAAWLVENYGTAADG